MEKSAYKVLFLEDEPTIREVLTEYMTITGYDVTEVSRGDQAVELLGKNKYDIAILDIMVPGVDGFEVLSYMKEHCSETAVIMLTALEDEKTQVKAFNLYADDYVIKPVSPIILLKRMETILRRTYKKQTETEEKKDGLYLKEEAYCAFYEDYIGNDRIIDAHVKNLRKKLPIPCIKTVIGVGYQFDKNGELK